MSSIQIIYLVDDDPDDRFFIKQALMQNRRGVEVIEATSGFELLTLIQQQGLPHATLILMDMNMPELDGWEATRIIRSQGSIVPIIAITAHAMPGDRERAIEAGCTQYHTKPVELDKLLETIESLLSGSGQS